MNESKIERKLTDYCRKKKILCYKFSSPAKAGVPDRILIFPKGLVIFVELKATGAKPTALQDRELTRIKKQGAHAVWFDDWEKIRIWVDTVMDLPAPPEPTLDTIFESVKVDMKKFHYDQFI
jgi:hypothetical protein